MCIDMVTRQYDRSFRANRSVPGPSHRAEDTFHRNPGFAKRRVERGGGTPNYRVLVLAVGTYTDSAAVSQEINGPTALLRSLASYALAHLFARGFFSVFRPESARTGRILESFRQAGTLPEATCSTYRTGQRQ
jgi:hypothetical protein